MDITSPFWDQFLNTLGAFKQQPDIAHVLPQESWVALDYMLLPENMEMIRGGDHWEARIAYKRGQGTHFTSPGAIRNPQIHQYTTKVTANFAHMIYEVPYLEDEMLRQRTGNDQADAKAIVDVIKVRRVREFLNWAQTLEERLFELPTTSEGHETFAGIPHHLKAITAAQAATSGATGDFQGGNPLAAGGGTASSWQGRDLSDSEYENLRNYCAGWDADSADSITFSDENMKRLSRMLRRLKFKTPMGGPVKITSPSIAKRRIMTDEYTNWMIGMGARRQNDNLGNDALKYVSGDDGVVLVAGVPVRVVDQLDTADTTVRGAHPLYVVNLDYLYFAAREGKWMMQRPPATDEVHQPDAVVEYVDSELQLVVSDPQKAGGVISYREAA